MATRRENTESHQEQAHHRGGRGTSETGHRGKRDPEFDPFLLLDDFRRTIRPLPEGLSLASPPRHRNDYLRARGTVEHGDSMGNQGVIAAGDVQWMTAGSGIIHQEMPKGDEQGRCTASSSGRTCRPPTRDGPALPGTDTRPDTAGLAGGGLKVRVVCGNWRETGGRSGTSSSTRSIST